MKFFNLFCLVLLFGFSVRASQPGAISSATAGSGRASVEASESPFLNPATLPFLRGYFFTSSYNASTGNKSDWRLSLTDNMKDTILPTTLAYTRSSAYLTNGEQIRSQDLRLAIAERIKNRIGIGLAFHHKTDQVPDQSYAQTNMVLSGVWSINDSLSAGLVFDDIIGASDSVPEAYRLKTKTSGGLSYNYKKVVRAKLDVVSADNNGFAKPSLLGGVESYMNRWLILRVGTGRDNEKSSNIYSGGLGFLGPRFGIHYAYLQSNEDKNFIRHTLDVAIPVW